MIPTTEEVRESATQPWHEPEGYDQAAEEARFDAWLTKRDAEVIKTTVIHMQRAMQKIGEMPETPASMDDFVTECITGIVKDLRGDK